MPGNFNSIPPSVYESWPKPNYVDPVRRTWMPAYSCVFLAVGTLLVAGRFYLRARGQAGAFGLDDVLIFIAWLFSVGATALACIMTMKYGIDRHAWDNRPEWIPSAVLVAWIEQFFTIASLCATKCSVLLFYRRMVKDIGKWKYAIWGAIAVTLGYLIGFIIALSLMCQPLDAYWRSYDLIHPYTKPYKCIDGDPFNFFAGAVSVISDVYAVFLPMIVLRHYDLEVSRRQMIGLRIVFGLGLVVAGAGIARTYTLWQLNHAYDTSWTGFNLLIWTIAETHLAIICACAPSLRVFLRRYLNEPLKRRLRGSSYRSKQMSKTTELSNTQVGSKTATRDSAADADIEHQPLKGEMLSEVREEESEAGDPRSTSLARRSSDTAPRIRTADDYEAFAMKQLSRQSGRASTATTGETMAYDHTDPGSRPAAGNARSWLENRS